jgi:hypothetical protein
VVKRRAVQHPTPPEGLAFLRLPSLAILQLQQIMKDLFQNRGQISEMLQEIADLVVSCLVVEMAET